MKRGILSLIIILFSVGYLNAQSVNFINGKWEEAREKAKSENKYLFVDCYTEWCGWCKILDKNTFSNAKVAELMNVNFVSVKIDMEKDYGINLAMKYRVNAFPTGLIFNSNGQLVYRILGYQAAEQFITTVSKAMNQSDQHNMQGISTNVDLDFPQFYKDIFAGNGKRKWPEQKVVTDFLDQQKDLFDEISWSVIAICNVGEKYEQFFLANTGKYSELFGSEADDKVNSILYGRLNKAIQKKDNALYTECLNDVDKYLSSGKEEIRQSFKLRYYSGINDWKNFSNEFKIYLEKNGYSNAATINTYCWAIYEKCDDRDVISSACGWMKKALEFDSQYAYVDTYASLLFKNKNYQEAEKYANQAIITGKKAGEDVKSTEELLAKVKTSLHGKN
jgi:thioredoxin-related protein